MSEPQIGEGIPTTITEELDYLRIKINQQKEVEIENTIIKVGELIIVVNTIVEEIKNIKEIIDDLQVQINLIKKVNKHE